MIYHVVYWLLAMALICSLPEMVSHPWCDCENTNICICYRSECECVVCRTALRPEAKQ